MLSAAYASLISVVYPISLFAYAALTAPRPTKGYWRLVLAYSSIVICLKFLFQLSFLCVCYSDKGERYSIYSNCQLETCQYPQVRSLLLPTASAPTHPPLAPQTSDPHLGLSHVIGIYKISGLFLSDALWDVVVILAVLWHRHQMKMKVLFLRLRHPRALTFDLTQLHPNRATGTL